MKPPCCGSSRPCWPKPATNGNQEKFTSTWNAKIHPQFELAKFTDKQLARPGNWTSGGGFSSGRNLVVVGLTPGTMYDFRVAFVGGNNATSEWSDLVAH